MYSLFFIWCSQLNHVDHGNNSLKRNTTTLHKKRESRTLKRPRRRLAVEPKELVHIQKSPNYCKQDFENGVLGTEGRKCNSTTTGPDSCHRLCCGRGYATKVILLFAWLVKKKQCFNCCLHSSGCKGGRTL